MPFKKHSKVPAWKRKGAAKKMVRRRRGYTTINLAKSRTLNPIPQRMIAKHKYATSVQASTAGGSVATYLFNLNSMWDPDRTGTGHQPYGRDTYVTLYNRYRVIGCSYRIAVVPQDPSLISQVAVVPSNSASIVYTDVATAREQPRCKYIIQQPNSPQKFVSGYVSIPSLMGRTKVQYMTDDNYQAQTGTSPSELALLNILAGSFTDAPLPETFWFNVELEFTCEWFDPFILPQS